MGSQQLYKEAAEDLLSQIEDCAKDHELCNKLTLLAKVIRENLDAVQSTSMHYGIWHEAWETCCGVHKIDMTDYERERCSKAAEGSYYATQSVDQSENTEINEATES